MQRLANKASQTSCVYCIFSPESFPCVSIITSHNSTVFSFATVGKGWEFRGFFTFFFAGISSILLPPWSEVIGQMSALQDFRDVLNVLLLSFI